MNVLFGPPSAINLLLALPWGTLGPFRVGWGPHGVLRWPPGYPMGLEFPLHTGRLPPLHLGPSPAVSGPGVPRGPWGTPGVPPAPPLPDPGPQGTRSPQGPQGFRTPIDQFSRPRASIWCMKSFGGPLRSRGAPPGPPGSTIILRGGWNLVTCSFVLVLHDSCLNVQAMLLAL